MTTTRTLCPLDCGWHHDQDDTDRNFDFAPFLEGDWPADADPAAASVVAVRALLAEKAIRDHCETHPLLDWVKALTAARDDLAIAEQHIERGNTETDRAWALVRSLLNVLRPALEKLPGECRYHGTLLDPPDGLIRREACCDTGVAALRRRNAQRVVDHIEAQRTSRGGEQR